MFSGGGAGETVRTRVLVAHDDEYRAYREVIAASIRALRPHAVVARFGPQVVVCGRQGVADPGDTPAWVELPPEFGRPARVRVGGSRRSHTNPTLEDLLGVVDEAEKLVWDQADRRGDRGSPGSIHPTS